MRIVLALCTAFFACIMPFPFNLLAMVIFPAAMSDFFTGYVETAFFWSLGFAFITFYSDLAVVNVSGALAVFAVAFALCKFGAMGEGDPPALALFPLMLGVKTGLQVLAISVIIGGMLSAIGLLTKKVTRQSEVPLLPFLAIGCLLGAYLIT